ncbi:hypothetical protein RSAG8_02990, partial [Rhizoctonia solani AG-8 WAC10335]
MLSSITLKSTGQPTRAVAAACNKEHANHTRALRREMPAPTRVPGDQLVPGHPNIPVPNHVGWRVVATSAVAAYLTAL